MSRKGVNIHEYQGKALFREEGVAVQEGIHCTTVDQALEAYDSLGSKIVAVKSQIHAGGRGKGNLYCPDTGDLQMEGGVKIALSRDEVETYSKNILGNILVTKQSGPEGKMVNNLYSPAVVLEDQRYAALGESLYVTTHLGAKRPILGDERRQSLPILRADVNSLASLLTVLQRLGILQSVLEEDYVIRRYLSNQQTIIF